MLVTNLVRAEASEEFVLVYVEEQCVRIYVHAGMANLDAKISQLPVLLDVEMMVALVWTRLVTSSHVVVTSLKLCLSNVALLFNIHVINDVGYTFGMV